MTNENLGQGSALRSLIPQRPPTHSIRTQLDQGHLYTVPQDSAELLLPPSGSRSHKFRDDDSPLRTPRSPAASGYSSRRTSWSGSDRSRDSAGYDNPFTDSRALRAESDDEGVNTQTVSEKYNILPSAGLLLFPEDIEKDDYLHTPDPSGKDNERDCDVCSRRGLINVGGLGLITIGLLFLFVGYPVL